MLIKARSNYPDINFFNIDVTTGLDKLGTDFDIVFSNVCIQWLPNHRQVLRNFIEILNPNGVVAVQTPLASHLSFYHSILKIIKLQKWKNLVQKETLFHNLTIEEYHDVLGEIGSVFTIWKTSYYHRLDSHQEILEWFRGTELRAYFEQLEKEEWLDFEADILQSIIKDYPTSKNGEILFEFPRLFFTVKPK